MTLLTRRFAYHLIDKTPTPLPVFDLIKSGDYANPEMIRRTWIERCEQIIASHNWIIIILQFNQEPEIVIKG